MDFRAHYFITVLEKIGLPLLEAVVARADSNGEDLESAQKVAALLGKSVQASIALGELIDLGVMGEQSDPMRLALAGLSAPIIADIFKHHGRIAVDSDIKNINEAMQAVLTFSENFTPGQDHTNRLQNITPDNINTDSHQMNAQYLACFIPVIGAVQEFSFGQQETILINDIAGRLTQRAEAIASSVAQGDSLKSASLHILSSVAQVYADCHQSETKRILAMSDDERSAMLQNAGSVMATDGVWQAFDARMRLLGILTENMVGASDGSGVAPVAAAPLPETPVTEKSQSVDAPVAPSQDMPQTEPEKPAIFGGGVSSDIPSTPPETLPPTPPPTEAVTAPPDVSASGADNPMTFFGADTSDNTPNNPPESAPDTPPSVAPDAPSENPAQNKDDDDKNSDDGDDPMSFFKKT